MKKTLLTLFALILTGNLAFAGQGEIEFTEYQLDNGLHVILHQDNSTPIVAVSVMYHVGSKNEQPDRTGFAHFFEHLMFEGTENIPRGEYSKYVEKAGGTLNANTTADRTYYYEIMPSNQLEMGLWLESERMLHAKVDSMGIQTQKGVVIEEKKQRYDNTPYGSLLTETMKRAFKEHPYRWTTIGDPDHIRAAKDEEFRSFYDEFYVPNNAVLVIAGDINTEDAKAKVEKYFGSIPAGEKEIYRPDIVEPPLGGEVRDTIFDNIQLPLLIHAYRTPALNTPDYYALEMLNTLLSDGESSRLKKALVDNQQIALQINSFPLPFRDPSVNIVMAFPNMGKDLKVLETAMETEIEEVKNNLIGEKEFQKLKNQIESDFVTGNTRIATRANNLARYHTFFGNADLINTEIDNYLAVTREDIQRAAQKYFTKDNRVVLFYLPKNQQ
ncbi:M16 family metallopeptidase [Marinilabilia salmonicolor]|uniref:M16 family metallopeptidase n=1 Tax=Marinilabilia salmonicolor TaxID=989 RepID=UPI001F331407|nr:pitrilysin family protein [Marinilabilia salmonicolor]